MRGAWCVCAVRFSAVSGANRLRRLTLEKYQPSREEKRTAHTHGAPRTAQGARDDALD